MSIFQLGRAFDTLDVDINQFQMSGDTVSIAGDVFIPAGTTGPAGWASAVRDRLNALVMSRDEPVIPVVWSEDSTIDGFYKVESVTTSNPAAALVDGYVQWQAQLSRFGGGSLPQCEVYSTHSVRPNSASVTTTTLNGSNDYRRLAVPAAATDFWCGSQSTAATRTTSSGALSCWYLPTYPAALTSTFTVAPGDYYDGACEIRTGYGAAASQLVLGKYAPRPFDGMTISNGLVRVFLHPSIDTAFEVEVFDGSAWENLISGTGWRIEHDYGGGSNHQWDLSNASTQILRNSPERCTVRLVLAEAATVAQFGRVWIDLTVRRGDPFVGGLVQFDTNGSLSGVVAIEPTTSTASTALTGGLRASSTDLPEGNRAVWALQGGTSLTTTTGTGRIVQAATSTVSVPFMVGFELGGSGSSGIENAQDVLYQWFDTKSETMRVVRR